MSNRILRLAREPLASFLVIGAVLFVVGRRAERDDRVLHVRRGSLSALVDAEARRRHLRELPATDDAAVREQAINDELLYREGLRLGIDKNDAIVRQRVIEKMLLLSDDIGGDARPVTDRELADYLASHVADHARPDELSFIHVFSASSQEPLVRLRPTLAPGVEGDAAVPPSVGDPFPLGRRVVNVPLAAVAQNYGPAFRDTLARLPLGTWSEPLQSRYGYHLVKVIARHDGGLPALTDVRAQVRVAYLQERKARATEELLRSIRARYTVKVDDRADGLGLGGSSSGEAD